MPSQTSNISQDAANGRTYGEASVQTKSERVPVSNKSQDDPRRSPKKETSGLQDYQLGDLLGKGASGAVYRALNWGTGETVAVKQVKLANLPRSELRVITLEIDLLKNLNHPNIVKYHGFIKSSDSLYIILEYCENGSLHSISKNFGKFPDNLVALYMTQVLHGLVYLHDQGVIHRDIKGANILTTKEGLVKLADFGVATQASGLHESSVVGTPYWMAPEVIELSGATTASDIWSLGCTVIELIDGKPPYHKLPPMPALFRIVNDDHPPFPEIISPAVSDFLMQCFQKEPNLRVTARKLLKHPWIVNAKRSESILGQTEEVVRHIQEWNESLRSPDFDSIPRNMRHMAASPTPMPASMRKASIPEVEPEEEKVDEPRQPSSTHVYESPPSDRDHRNIPVWDDDFECSISPKVLQKLPQLPKDNYAGMLSTEKLKAYAISGNVLEDGDVFKGPGSSNGQAESQDTVRANSPIKTRVKTPSSHQHRSTKVTERVPSQPKTQILRPPKPTPPPLQVPPVPVKRTSSAYREKVVEEYDDLSPNDDAAFNEKLRELALKTEQEQTFSPKLFHPSDLQKQPRRSSKASKAGGSLRHDGAISIDRPDSTMRRTQSNVEILKFADHDYEDYSDIFGKHRANGAIADSEAGSEVGGMNMLSSKMSVLSWLGDDEDEEDPFAGLEDFDSLDLDAKVARDKYFRTCTFVESLISSLKVTQPDDVLETVSEQLIQVLFENPDFKTVIISSHGLLPILEVLDNCTRRDVSLRLLKIINTIISESQEIQETLCFVGGIPIVTKFAHKKFSNDIRLEAAAFVRQMYQTSTLTLQMFISCGGLNVLVEFLEEDYEAETDLVLIGVNGISAVFNLQGPTPKNDFCRILSRSSVLYPLSLVLNRVLDEKGELSRLIEGRITDIFLLFSKAENHVKEMVADRMVLKRVLKDLQRMSPEHQITMLKFIKNLSMLSTTLDPLHQSNVIEVLTDLLRPNVKDVIALDDQNAAIQQPREVCNQILTTIFNLCRLSKTRQEDAALNGIVPILQDVVRSKKPMKELALPILCDMAHSGKVTRKILWQNKGLDFYVDLLEINVNNNTQSWHVAATDAIFVWLQEETARVEEHLLKTSFGTNMAKAFASHTADVFNLLEPLQKLLRLSPQVAATLAHADLFRCVRRRLSTGKALVRGNLLRIIRSICDGCDDQVDYIREYGLYEAIEKLANHDPAILVRNMASDLIKSSDSIIRHSSDGKQYRLPRRTSSSTMTPPPLYTSQSQPQTPQHMRSSQSTSYFDITTDTLARARAGNTNGSTPYRPVSRDGSKLASESSNSSANSSSTPSTRSRLPRTSAARLNRSSVSSRREDNATPASATSQTNGAPSGSASRSNLVVNRRRRQTSGAG